jgi:hypothetical protein
MNTSLKIVLGFKISVYTDILKREYNKFGFPESLKCHLFGITKFYRASCAWNNCLVSSLFFRKAAESHETLFVLFHIAAWAT